MEGWRRMDGKNKRTMIQEGSRLPDIPGIHSWSLWKWSLDCSSTQLRALLPKEGLHLLSAPQNPKTPTLDGPGKKKIQFLGMFSSQGIPHLQSCSASTAGSVFTGSFGVEGAVKSPQNLCFSQELLHLAFFVLIPWNYSGFTSQNCLILSQGANPAQEFFPQHRSRSHPPSMEGFPCSRGFSPWIKAPPRAWRRGWSCWNSACLM